MRSEICQSDVLKGDNNLGNQRAKVSLKKTTTLETRVSKYQQRKQQPKGGIVMCIVGLHLDVVNFVVRHITTSPSGSGICSCCCVIVRSTRTHLKMDISSEMGSSRRKPSICVGHWLSVCPCSTFCTASKNTTRHLVPPHTISAPIPHCCVHGKPADFGFLGGIWNQMAAKALAFRFKPGAATTSTIAAPTAGAGGAVGSNC